MLDENDQLDVGDRGKEIIEKAYKFGYDFERHVQRLVLSMVEGKERLSG